MKLSCYGKRTTSDTGRIIYHTRINKILYTQYDCPIIAVSWADVYRITGLFRKLVGGIKYSQERLDDDADRTLGESAVQFHVLEKQVTEQIQLNSAKRWMDQILPDAMVVLHRNQQDLFVYQNAIRLTVESHALLAI
jgi:hypothetical protein